MSKTNRDILSTSTTETPSSTVAKFFLPSVFALSALMASCAPKTNNVSKVSDADTRAKTEQVNPKKSENINPDQLKVIINHLIQINKVTPALLSLLNNPELQKYYSKEQINRLFDTEELNEEQSKLIKTLGLDDYLTLKSRNDMLPRMEKGYSPDDLKFIKAISLLNLKETLNSNQESTNYPVTTL
jgi:hypothetical protein